MPPAMKTNIMNRLSKLAYVFDKLLIHFQTFVYKFCVMYRSDFAKVTLPSDNSKSSSASLSLTSSGSLETSIL